MFHTGAQIPGDYPSLTGTGETSRVMKFADAADLKLKAAELKRLVKAWCDQRDEA